MAELQERLLALGFTPDRVDGVFGPSTEKAVRGFQRGVGLDVDGRPGARDLGRSPTWRGQCPEGRRTRCANESLFVVPATVWPDASSCWIPATAAKTPESLPTA